MSIHPEASKRRFVVPPAGVQKKVCLEQADRAWAVGTAGTRTAGPGRPRVRRRARRCEGHRGHRAVCDLLGSWCATITAAAQAAPSWRVRPFRRGSRVSSGGALLPVAAWPAPLRATRTRRAESGGLANLSLAAWRPGTRGRTSTCGQRRRCGGLGPRLARRTGGAG